MSSIAFQLTGNAHGRLGNRSGIGSAPQGVYPCAGTDQWIALEITNDHEWDELCGVVGRPSGIGEQSAGLASQSDRWTHHDALDDWLTSVTTTWDTGELTERLVRAGVPASVVISPPQVIENPQLRHRGLFETEDHPVTGRHNVPGLPFTMAGVDAWIRSPAPLLGEHNDEVLGDLGLDATERDALRAIGIIGEELVGS
jgi:crotonobetainyl-CoA:carnitine CoA-transferase CaiB-like acyl-CoA transferase